MSGFHPIRVEKVERLTPEAVCISLDVPLDLKQEFVFEPGQYITVKFDINGAEQRRSYSICSSLNEKRLRIGVKKVEQGIVSSYINDQVKMGQIINVMGPQGRFTPKQGESKLLLLASGSGITPCLSIAKSLLENEMHSEITLVYGNRSRLSMMFRNELSRLKDKYTSRLSVIYLMSRETQNFDLLNGRLDAVKLQDLVTHGMIQPETFDAAFICGPEAMIQSTSEYLQSIGMDKSAIKFELFGTVDNKTKKHTNRSNAMDDAFVEITLDGSQQRIPVDGSKETVLSAARSAGIELPFSCEGGMCCTCRCKITEGKAEMDVNYSLEEWEIESGFTLACQARPKSKIVKLDFDAA